MQKATRFIAVAMAAALGLSAFAGCQGTGTEGTGDASVLKIGGIGPTTGSNAMYGQGVENAAELAVDEINANGGVNGMKF